MPTPLHASLDNARMLKTLLANVDGMVYRRRLDADWTVEFVSQGCLRVTGHQATDLLLNKRVAYDDLTLPDDRLWVREAIRCALAEFRSFDIEYRIVHADGSSVIAPVDVASMMVLGPNGGTSPGDIFSTQNGANGWLGTANTVVNPD